MGILLLLFPVYLYMRPAHLLLSRTHNVRGRRRSLPLFFSLSHVVKSHRLIPEPQMIGPWPVLSVSGSPPSPRPQHHYTFAACADAERFVLVMTGLTEGRARGAAVCNVDSAGASGTASARIMAPGGAGFYHPPEVCHQVGHRMPRDLQVEFGWR